MSNLDTKEDYAYQTFHKDFDVLIRDLMHQEKENELTAHSFINSLSSVDFKNVWNTDNYQITFSDNNDFCITNLSKEDSQNNEYSIHTDDLRSLIDKANENTIKNAKEKLQDVKRNGGVFDAVKECFFNVNDKWDSIYTDMVHIIEAADGQIYYMDGSTGSCGAPVNLISITGDKMALKSEHDGPAGHLGIQFPDPGDSALVFQIEHTDSAWCINGDVFFHSDINTSPYRWDVIDVIWNNPDGVEYYLQKGLNSNSYFFDDFQEFKRTITDKQKEIDNGFSNDEQTLKHVVPDKFEEIATEAEKSEYATENKNKTPAD